MFVTCGKDKFVDVVNAVVKQLNVWVRKELDGYWQNNTEANSRAEFLWGEDYKAQAELFTNGVKLQAYNMDCVEIIFGCGDDPKRVLNILPNCSCDYEDTFEGDKIIFSIGHWGKNHSIMNQVAIALESFGDVYYDHNDCDYKDFVLVYDFCENSSQFKGE
tara:strand:+ start:84218 stop:84700 length:483 start_codon:yes stop_codon:yes gene_type:complete